MKATTIRIAAALIDRADGRTLLVRKRGTDAFMQPGGKIEPGEEPLRALCRELTEELDLRIEPAQARLLGCFSAPAANEPGHSILATLFGVRIDVDPQPGAEIAETIWIDPEKPGSLLLAPLTRDHVLPLCRAPRPGETTEQTTGRPRP